VSAAQLLIPPRIGQPWPGQGGTYAGLVRGEAGQPDQHVILADAKPPTRLAWAAGIKRAMTVEADGHADFSMPTRDESALLYTNLRVQMDGGWHWTSTQCSQGSAFGQTFDNGYQDDTGKKCEARVRAVRRFAAQSFNPSAASEAAE